MRWVKVEPLTRIWVDGGVCYKHYLVPLHLRWRTIAQRSRADRERENLERLAAIGLAVPKVVEVRERRFAGFVVDSTIATAWVDGAVDLEEWFAERPGGAHVELARELGSALARLHRAGLVSNSASPRNWLVVGTAVMLIDQVHMAELGRDVRGSSAASVDLVQLLTPKRSRARSTVGFRFRVLLRYCGEDREGARRLWRELDRVGRWRLKLRRWWNVVKSRGRVLM